MGQVSNRSHGHVDANLEHQTGRCGDWLQTYTGIAFWPLDPRPEDIDVHDIAHALSMICRFGGHSTKFYSVAEHSLLVAQCVPPEHRLQALLHDATEAYVGDMVRPLKQQLAEYREIEVGIWGAIAQRFDVPFAMHPSIKEADNAVLLAEKAALLVEPPIPWHWAKDLTPAPVVIHAFHSFTAELLFLQAFRELTA